MVQTSLVDACKRYVSILWQVWENTSKDSRLVFEEESFVHVREMIDADLLVQYLAFFQWNGSWANTGKRRWSPRMCKPRPMHHHSKHFFLLTCWTNPGIHMIDKTLPQNVMNCKIWHFAAAQALQSLLKEDISLFASLISLCNDVNPWLMNLSKYFLIHRLMNLSQHSPGLQPLSAFPNVHSETKKT